MRRVRDRVRRPGDPGWEAALLAAELPSRYWAATVEVIQVPSIRRWLEAAVADVGWLARGEGWYLHGPLNAGKSSVAAILLMDAVARCERALWLPVRDVPGVRFRETDQGKATNEKLAAADLVVLDDFGAERFRMTTAAGAALEEVVRIIYDRRRSLIITSNLGWGIFPSTYIGHGAEPLVSVVQRMVRPVTIVNNQWPGAPDVGAGPGVR